jgi:hypothetical protein
MGQGMNESSDAEAKQWRKSRIPDYAFGAPAPTTVAQTSPNICATGTSKPLSRRECAHSPGCQRPTS